MADGSRTRIGARLLTICTTCDQEVGVWTTPFNRTFKDRVTKTAKHYAPSGGRCAGSLLSIHSNTTWERAA